MLVLIVSSCTRNGGAAIERIAIIPANVLISDPASEWMSLGIALALEQDLATSHHVAAFLANGESGAYQRGATHILRTTVENYRGRLSMEAAITDLATQRNTQVVDANGPAAAGALAGVNALARRIDAEASAFSTHDERAWRNYTGAAAAQNLQTRAQLLTNAIEADPSFGLAYLVLAQTRSQMGQSDTDALMKSAEEHIRTFTPLDQARAAAFFARTHHASLSDLTKAADAVVAIAPNDVQALATSATDHFLQGDDGEGERLMNRALELSPGNRPLEAQLAEGLLESRRFRDAEKIFTGIDNNAAILPQLAVCILLERDVARANTVFSNYLRERAAANDTSIFLAQANWIAISKQPADAVQYLAKTNFKQDDLRSLASSQSAIWQLIDKDSAGAKQSAALAVQLATAPVPKLFGQIALLVANGDQPVAAWRDQVNAAPLEPSIKRTVLGYGLFLNARYAEAVQQWEELEKESGGADLRARAMLASSLDHAGRQENARSLRVEPFAPNLTGADQFAVLTFNEMRRLLNLTMR